MMLEVATEPTTLIVAGLFVLEVVLVVVMAYAATSGYRQSVTASLAIAIVASVICQFVVLG
jgi:putative flippase GtrA